MALVPKDTMTVADFLAWAETQDQGAFELWEGRIIAMAPQTLAHVRVKRAAADALRAAINTAGAPCESFIDGAAVVIDDHTSLQPDAIVFCGEALSGTLSAVPNPLIVVEVLSPSTQHIDKTRKLQCYFELPGLQHYLIIDHERGAVIHHRRQSDNLILTALIRSGDIVLDPPGLTIALHGLLG